MFYNYITQSPFSESVKNSRTSCPSSKGGVATTLYFFRLTRASNHTWVLRIQKIHETHTFNSWLRLRLWANNCEGTIPVSISPAAGLPVWWFKTYLVHLPTLQATAVGWAEQNWTTRGIHTRSRGRVLSSHLLTMIVVVGVSHFPIRPSRMALIVLWETTREARTSRAQWVDVFDVCRWPWILPIIESGLSCRLWSISWAAPRSSRRARPGNTHVENLFRIPARSPQMKCSSANWARWTRSGPHSVKIVTAPLYCLCSDVTGLRYRLIDIRSGKSSGTNAARTGRHLCREPDWLVRSSWISVWCHTARNTDTSVVDWLWLIPSRSVVPYPSWASLMAVDNPQPLRPFCMRTVKNLIISSFVNILSNLHQPTMQLAADWLTGIIQQGVCRCRLPCT